MSDASGRRRSQIGNDHPRFDPRAHSRARSLVLHQTRLSWSSFRVSFFSSQPGSLSLSRARAARSQSRTYIDRAIFSSANRYRSRSRSCTSITLKLRYPFDLSTRGFASSSASFRSLRSRSVPFSNRAREPTRDPIHPSWPDFHREIALNLSRRLKPDDRLESLRSFTFRVS